MRIVVASPITMGYGSPRYLRLYRVLAARGHRVLLVDHEEPAAAQRQPYRLDGYRRLLVRSGDGRNRLMRRGRRAWEDLRRRWERPDVLIAGSDALLGRPWPTVSTRVMYFGEIESELRDDGGSNHPATDAADAVIAPQADRLRLARGIYRRAGEFFCVHNAPLLEEHADSQPRSLEGRSTVQVLYQGQVTELTCADALLAFARRRAGRFHLHVAGPVHEEFRDQLSAAAAEGVLTYHGYLRRRDLAAIRRDCDVGLVTWRQGDRLPLSIKYACPNKLYEYIADGLPVVFMPNHSLGRLNERFRFGRVAAGYTPDALTEALSAVAGDEDAYAAQSAHNVRLFREELNFNRQTEPFAAWLQEQHP